MNCFKDQYPQLEIDLDKLRENLAALIERCHDSLVEVSPVIKGTNALPEIARVFAESGARYICTSRIDQVKSMRDVGIDTPIMLIRIPMLSEVEDVISCCEASLVSDITVIRALNAEAERQGKTHGVLLMIDLGDLREGFWDAEELVDAAVEIENELSHLHLLGVGTNLSCYGSVVPNKRNMQGLVSLSSDVERAVGRKLEYISGGASTSAYMVLNGTMPYRVNHLRLGEIVLNGRCASGAPDFLHRDVFTLRAEVVECREKPSFPVGELSVDAFGRTREYVDRGIRRRAIVDIGRVDYGDCADIVPRRKGVEVLGASSDHTILDVHDVEGELKVGDILEFDVDYASMVYLTGSRGVHVTFKGKKA